MTMSEPPRSREDLDVMLTAEPPRSPEEGPRHDHI